MSVRRILLLDPPFFRFLDEDQRGVPMGLAYLAGALRGAGFEDVVIYNADFDPQEGLGVCNRGYFDEMSRFDDYLSAVTNDDHPIYREVLETVRDFSPDLIAMSVRTAKFYISKTLIRLLREAFGAVPIVVGGPHATANPEHVLTRTEADFVVRGEGERTLLELVQTLDHEDREFGTIEGLSYRRGETLMHNPDRPFIADLDTLPLPARDLILNRQRMAPDDFSNLFSSRGCPFACAYCDSRRTWSRKVRRHSPQYIVEEIWDIKKRFGSTFFPFQDDCFVTDEKHLVELCQEMHRRGLAELPLTEFRWWCEIHPSLVTEDLIERMKNANCVAIAIGAESGSQRTLDSINKTVTPEMTLKAARIIREAGLSLSTFFMIGFPWETEQDIEQTLRFMEEVAPDKPVVSILTPLPGTPIYDYCRERSLVNFDEDFLTLFHQRNVHFYSEHISDERSREIIRNALERCEKIAQKTRRDKIARYLLDQVAPSIRDEEALLLEVVDKLSADELGERRFPSGVVKVTVAHSYTEEKIYLGLYGDSGRRLSRRGCERVGRLLLKEFPQYVAIELEEHTPEGTRTHVVEAHAAVS